MHALVLAAGLGTRLRPRTLLTPKCLVEVAGRPIIELVLERLATLPLGSIGVTAFHLKQQVIDHFGDGYPDRRIRVIPEERLLGTGGGIRNALGAMPPVTRLLVHNCDILTDMDLRELVAAHERSGADATLAVRSRRMPRSLVFGPDGRLLGRSRDLAPGRSHPSLVAEFCGIHILGPRMADFIRTRSDSKCVIDLLVNASAAGLTVRAFDIGPASWIDLGTPASLAEYEREILMVDRMTARAQAPA